MNDYYVYLWTNLKNGKSYVGKGRKTRCSRHVKESRKEKPYGLLAKAMKKHGMEAFKQTFLEIGLADDEAQLWEVYYIALLNTNLCRGGHGYNMTDGGDGTSGHRRKWKPLSAETKLKLSAALKGKHKSPEHRRKISDGNKGKPKSPEYRKQLSDNNPMSHTNIARRTFKKLFAEPSFPEFIQSVLSRLS